MLKFLEDESKTDLRQAALEHWHRSLELDPDQPRIRRLIDRYRPHPSQPEDALLRENRASAD